jgi:hypothetical protein
VRGEALGIGDRHGRTAQRPLEGTGEVPVRGEAQRTALGVPDPDPLDDRRLAADGLVLRDGDTPSLDLRRHIILPLAAACRIGPSLSNGRKPRNLPKDG